jgi:hypothetical protein
MSTTTQLGSIARFIMPNASLDNAFDDYLGEFIADYDVESLVNTYRAAINNNLDGTTLVLVGDEIICGVPVPDSWDTLVADAIEAVDVAELTARFDTAA